MFGGNESAGTRESPTGDLLPEEEELHKKRQELNKLESELVRRELELATLKAEMRAFEQQYLLVIGRRYAEIDAIEAEIAATIARADPSHKGRMYSAEAHVQAEGSPEAVRWAEGRHSANYLEPSENLKKLYRAVVKRIHPDLSSDEVERLRRTQLMAEANRAYEEGDEARLRAILHEWESSPESVRGDGIGSELIRVIRKVAQIKKRLIAIENEIQDLKASDLYRLWLRVKEAEKQGRDLLAEMAARLDADIAKARERLQALRARDQT